MPICMYVCINVGNIHSCIFQLSLTGVNDL